jgi:type IV secretory pathway VirJ component
MIAMSRPARRIRVVLAITLVLGLSSTNIVSAQVPSVQLGGASNDAAAHPPSREISALSDLPLVEVRASPGPLLVVLLSGDGGWAPADKSLAAAFAARGVAVIGFDSPSYLSRERTPDEAARDLERILREYMRAWNRERVLIIGYSRGANIAPFMVSRLPAELRERIALAALLGPWEWAGFKFHFIDILRNVHRDGDLPVRPEVQKLRGMGLPVLCVYGSEDRASICPSLGQAGLARAIQRDGGHRVGGSEGPALADTILSVLPKSE